MTVSFFKTILKPETVVSFITETAREKVYCGAIGEAPAEYDSIEVEDTSVDGDSTALLLKM